MQKLLSSVLMGFGLLLLSACGGGGGSDGGGEGATVLSGVVEDGPIAGARISLIDSHEGEVVSKCGASGAGRCETVSAADGTFSFPLPSGTNLGGVEIVSLGGVDQETGVEFAGIRLRAPASLFIGREGEMTVSPLTTLLCVRMQEGASLFVAQDEVRQWLGLGPEIELSGRPSKDTVLERYALFLTALALETNRAGHADPFQGIGHLLDPARPLLVEGVANAVVLKDLNLEAAAGRVGEMAEALKTSPENLSATFKRTLVRQGLRQICERMLAADTQFDAQNPNYLANLDLLAERVLAAAGSTRIPLGDGIAPQRIARYLLFTYGLTAFDRFSVDTTTFRAGLKHPDTGRSLDEDPYIAELASLKAVYSTAVPLLADEIPGNDNRRRLEYFYNSDLSPFYFAEKVNEEILDDEYSDAVMIKIARGKADAGLFAEAETIVATQIFQTGSRGEGYYELADVLINFGRFPEAIAALQKSESFFRKVIEVKGYANIKITDVTALQRVGSAYRRAGDLNASIDVFNYLANVAVNQATASTYGSVIVGLETIVGEYLKDGQKELAMPFIDKMYELSSLTPAGADGSYLFKVMNLLKTANGYFNVGNDPMFYSVYVDVKNIRNSHSSTASKTWNYMENFVELLYRSGRVDEADSLAEEMPDANATKAYKVVATYEAVQNGLSAALEIIEKHISKPADKVEALTYLLNNKSREYVALALINRNVLDVARQALDEAVRQMEFLDPASDLDRYQQLVQRGYVKIADLYALAGSPEHAKSLLQDAEASLEALTGRTYRIDGLIDIANGYYALGNAPRAGQLLDQARVELGTALDTAVAPANPADRSKMYQEFALVYEHLLNACLGTDRSSNVARLIDEYAAVVRQIFDAQAVYADKDKIAGTEMDKLVKAANYRRLAGDFAGIGAFLEEAEGVARQIGAEATRNGKLIDIIAAHAAAGQFDLAREMAGKFVFSLDRHRALQSIAMAYAERDDFPDSRVAGIDTDHDGRPDFFHPLVGSDEISASGLGPDDDSDGDGIPDPADRRPLVYDRPAV